MGFESYRIPNGVCFLTQKYKAFQKKRFVLVAKRFALVAFFSNLVKDRAKNARHMRLTLQPSNLANHGSSSSHLTGRNPEFFLKHRRKIFFIAKADLRSHIRNHAFAMLQQFHGLLQTITADEIGGGLIGNGL